ncbi:MAG: dockerin type I repeat-containing protein [Clostridia bacterium]|nr:dockerin type I repeat-containing protein [Clostridia bacterium]
MKKILKTAFAITIALCLLVSSLVFAEAEATYTKVYKPYYLNEAGDGEYTVRPADVSFPSWIQKANAYFTPTEDISDFGLTSGLKFTNPSSDVQTQIYMAPMTYAEASGYIFRIESDATGSFKLPMYIIQSTNGVDMQQKYHYYTNWYILADGASNWELKDGNAGAGYSAEFPAGFDGYVYIPFESMSNGGTAWADTDTIHGIVAWMGSGFTEATISMPMFVDRATLVNGLPTADKVIYEDAEVTFFSADDNTSDDEETSLYTKVYESKFMNANRTAEIAVSPRDTAFPSSVQTTTAKHFTPVRDRSDFGLPAGLKFEPTSTNNGYMQFSTMTYGEASGYIFHVKNHLNAEYDVPMYILQVNGDSVAAAYNYYVKYYILRDGDTAWRSATGENYGPRIPANFEGYIYIPFDSMPNSSMGAWRDDIEICGFLARGRDGVEMNATFSAPLFVDRDTLVNGLPTADKVIFEDSEVEFFSKTYESATTYTKVYESKIMNSAGTAEYPVFPYDTAFPSWMQQVNTHFTPTADNSDFGLPVGMQFNNPASGQAQLYFSTMTYAEAAGYIIRVTSDNTAPFKIPIYLIFKNDGAKLKYQHSGVKWFLLEEGDIAWEEVAVDGYGVEMPAGFDGYLYIPFDTLSDNGSKPFVDVDAICGISVWNASGLTTTATLSIPMFVDRKTLNDKAMPTADKVLFEDNEIAFFSNEGGSGDDVVIEKPTTEAYEAKFLNEAGDAEYQVNSYDKELPWWLQYSQMNETIRNFTPTVDPTGFGFATGLKYTNQTDTDVNNSVYFAPRSYADTAGFIIHISSDATSNFTVPIYIAYSTNGGETYQQRYSYYTKWYVLAKGATEWVYTEGQDYGVSLPAGFDGYIYIPFDTMNNNGSLSVMADTDLIGGIVTAKGKGYTEATLSMPLFVKRSSLDARGVPTADKIILDGKEKVLFSSVGDADADGTVGATDLASLRKWLLKNNDVSAKKYLDANGDSKVDVADLIRLKKYLAGEGVRLG